jgi:hypothetical protein
VLFVVRKRLRSRDACAPEFWQRHWQENPRSGIASGLQTAVVAACGPILLIGNAVGFASADPPDEEGKEKIRRQNADRRVFNGRALRGAARARKRSALACRRSTAALAAATERRRSTPVTRFLGRY